MRRIWASTHPLGRSFSGRSLRAAWELARREVVGIKELLSPLQISMVPGTIQYLTNATGKIMTRMLFRHIAGKRQRRSALIEHQVAIDKVHDVGEHESVRAGTR